VDALAAAAEDASLAPSRWCRSRDCRRRDTSGCPAIVIAIIIRAAGAVVLVFPLPLALTLAFASIIGVGGKRGRSHWRTRWFLLWWSWRQLLLRRAPST
jgi:hypothetical protein